MKNKKRYIGLFILNFLFLMFQIAGFRLSCNPTYEWNIVNALTAMLIAAALGLVLDFAFFFLYDRIKGKSNHKDRKKLSSFFERLTSFPVLWLIFFVGYIPMFLVFFPGICAYDAYIQLEQCVSHQFIDHHPFLHTLIINFFYSTGKALGNLNIGIALFVLLQMLLLSAAFAGCVSVLKKNGCKRGFVIALLLYFLLYPYHVYIALSITKAALFTAAFAPLCILLCVTLSKGRNSVKFAKEDWIIALLCFPTVAFRTNARYALMLVVAVLIVTVLFSKNRKQYARVLISVGGGLAVSLAIIGVLYKAFNVVQGDRREMLSVPIQQLARTAYYHSDELSGEEMTEINGFILNEAWKDYDPVIADPVKRNVNTNRILSSTQGMIKTYVGLLKIYPGEFVNAVLTLDAGYLYVADQTHLSVYGDDFGLGFVQTRWADDMYSYGASKQSLFPKLRDRIERFLSENKLQTVPIIGILFTPGIVLWTYLYFGLWAIHNKRYHVLCALLLALAYIGTLIMGPTVQMRYIYPVWALLPMCMAAAGIDRNVKEP